MRHMLDLWPFVSRTGRMESPWYPAAWTDCWSGPPCLYRHQNTVLACFVVSTVGRGWGGCAVVTVGGCVGVLVSVGVLDMWRHAVRMVYTSLIGMNSGYVCVCVCWPVQVRVWSSHLDMISESVSDEHLQTHRVTLTLPPTQEHRPHHLFGWQDTISDRSTHKLEVSQLCGGDLWVCVCVCVCVWMCMQNDLPSIQQAVRTMYI